MERARGILAKARATLANERIWMKSALVERERGETDEARNPVLYLLQFICTGRTGAMYCLHVHRLSGKPDVDSAEWHSTVPAWVLMGVCSVSCRS